MRHGINLLRFPVRTQFFLSYGVLGCLLPYLAVYLQRDLGMRETTLGWLFAFMSGAVVLSPVLMTALADRRMSGRRLLGGIFLACAVCLLLIALIGQPWAVFVFFGAHAFLFVSLLPLQDGLFFSVDAARRERGKPVTPYHHIRVWGAVGFIVPGLLLLGLFSAGMGLSTILYLGAAFAVLGFLNALRLPSFEPVASKGAGAGSRTRLPTVEAARVLWHRPVFIFCIALFLANLASSAYFSFFPLYLTREAGFSPQVAGLVFNGGVVVEVFFILGFGWAAGRFGLRRVMVLALAGLALRMGLLASFPQPKIVILGQALHGCVVIALQIGPILYLNSLARDDFRNSMQGIHTMLIAGVSRIFGNVLAGHLAAMSLTLAYGVSAALMALSALLLLLFFREAGSAEGDRVAPPGARETPAAAAP